LSKSNKYFFDNTAIREPLAQSSIQGLSQNIENQTGSTRGSGGLKHNGNMKATGKVIPGGWSNSNYFKNDSLLINDGRTIESKEKAISKAQCFKRERI
jgi:hypothetical protein